MAQHTDDLDFGVLNTNHRDFFMIDNEITDVFGGGTGSEYIGKNELLVYMALVRFANKEGICYPGIRRLSATSHVCLTDIRTALKKLVDVGLLRIEARFQADSKIQISNLYILTDVKKAVISFKANLPQNTVPEKEGADDGTDLIQPPPLYGVPPSAIRSTPPPLYGTHKKMYLEEDLEEEENIVEGTKVEIPCVHTHAHTHTREETLSLFECVPIQEEEEEDSNLLKENASTDHKIVQTKRYATKERSSKKDLVVASRAQAEDAPKQPKTFPRPEPSGENKIAHCLWRIEISDGAVIPAMAAGRYAKIVKDLLAVSPDGENTIIMAYEWKKRHTPEDKVYSFTYLPGDWTAILAAMRKTSDERTILTDMAINHGERVRRHEAMFNEYDRRRQ